MLERKEWLNNEQRKEKREEKEQRAYVVVSYMLPTTIDEKKSWQTWYI